MTAVRELAEAGILKCNTLMIEDGEFQGAVIELAGVKFGMNKGFTFITSRQDRPAIDSLITKISEFYGEPRIDEEGETEWSRYHWNLYDTIPGRPYIRIRPFHFDDGGLVMTWSF